MLSKIKKFIFAEEEEDEFVEEIQYEEKIITEAEMPRFVKEEEITNTVIEHTATMGKINVDVEQEITEVKEEVKHARVKPTTVRKEEYHMQPVISLINGSEESHSHFHTDDVKQSVKVPKKDSFNNVISPIYGVKEVKPILHHEEETAQASVQFINVEEVVDSQEDITNLSLDEIVSSKEDHEDLVQCSLFGEEIVIVEDSFNNEEVSEISDDSLPF